MRPVMAARPISLVLCCALGSADTMVAEANRQGNGWRSGGLLPLCRLAPLGQVKKGQMRHLGCVRVVDHGDEHLVLRGLEGRGLRTEKAGPGLFVILGPVPSFAAAASGRNQGLFSRPPSGGRWVDPLSDNSGVVSSCILQPPGRLTHCGAGISAEKFAAVKVLDATAAAHKALSRPQMPPRPRRRSAREASCFATSAPSVLVLATPARRASRAPSAACRRRLLHWPWGALGRAHTSRPSPSQPQRSSLQPLSGGPPSE